MLENYFALLFSNGNTLTVDWASTRSMYEIHGFYFHSDVLHLKFKDVSVREENGNYFSFYNAL